MGKHFQRGNLKSFVDDQRGKKFSLEIDFIIIILIVSGQEFWSAYQKICVFHMPENSIKSMTQG